MSDVHTGQDSRPAHLQVVTSEGEPAPASRKANGMDAFAAYASQHGDTPIGKPSKKSAGAPSAKEAAPSNGTPFGALRTEGTTSDARTADEPDLQGGGEGLFDTPFSLDPEKAGGPEGGEGRAPESSPPAEGAPQEQDQGQTQETAVQDKAQQRQPGGVTHAGVAVAPFAGLGAGLSALGKPLRRVASAGAAAPKAIIEAGSRSMCDHQYVETQRAQLKTSCEQIRKNHAFLQEAMQGASPEHFDEMCERTPSMKAARDANRKYADSLAAMLDDATEQAKSSRQVKSWLKGEAQPAIDDLSRDTADSHDKKFLEKVADLVDRVMEFIKQLFQRNPGKGARPSP